MRPPRRPAAAAVAAAVLAGAAAGCDAGRTTAVTDVLIGFDLTQASPVDTAYSRALQLRIEQVNASGRLGARRLVLAAADNRNDTATALRNITAFAADPAVAAVVEGVCGACAVGAVAAANERRVPLVALGAAPATTTPVTPYVFRIGPDVRTGAAVLAGALSRARVRSAAVLYSGDQAGVAARDALRARLDAAGVRTAATARVRSATGDPTGPVARAVAGAPGALVVLTGPDQAVRAAVAARRAGFTGRLLFGPTAAGDLFLPRGAAAATAGATLVSTPTTAVDDVVATTPAKAARRQWFRDYTSRYGGYSGTAAFAADAVQLVADAVAAVGPDRTRIRDRLETVATDGLTGPIRFSPTDHAGPAPEAWTTLTARGGRWHLPG